MQGYADCHFAGNFKLIGLMEKLAKNLEVREKASAILEKMVPSCFFHCRMRHPENKQNI